MAQDQRDTVWSEIGRIETCMMVTHDGEAMRARPMVGTAARDDGAIWFVASRKGHKDAEILSDPRVCLTYIDTARHIYLSVTGLAALVEDRGKLRQLWNDTIDAWFEHGPDDPDAVLLRVSPERAELWNNPSSDFVIALKTLVATSSGEQPQLGENVKVEL